MFIKSLLQIFFKSCVLLCVLSHVADFALLMCASQQWKVFENEKKEEWMVLAGENTDNPNPMDGRPFNPAPNFINCRYGQSRKFRQINFDLSKTN